MFISERVENIAKRNRLSVTAQREQRALLAQKSKERSAVEMATKRLRSMIAGAKKEDIETCTEILLAAAKSPEGVETALEFIQLMPWKLSVKDIKSFMDVSGKGGVLIGIFLDRLFDEAGEPCWICSGGGPQEEGRAFYFAILSLFTAMETAADISSEVIRQMASNLLDGYPSKIYEGDERLKRMVEGVEEKGKLPHSPDRKEPFPKACYASREKEERNPLEATSEEIERYCEAVLPATISLQEVAVYNNGNKKKKSRLQREEATV